MNYTQSQKQQLHSGLVPDQLQLMSLLQVSAAQLLQKIKEEAETNILLNPPQHDPQTVSSSQTEADQQPDISPYSDEPTEDADTAVPKLPAQTHRGLAADPAAEQPIQDLLIRQLYTHQLSATQQLAAEFIIHSLNEKGLLDRNVHTLQQDFSLRNEEEVDIDDFEVALQAVRSLDPVGIGQNSVQDCLIEQLQRKGYTPDSLVVRILSENYPLFLRKHYTQLQRAYQATNDTLQAAIEQICKLKPYPFTMENVSVQEKHHSIIPDFIVHERNDQLHVELCQEQHFEPQMNRYYLQMLRKYEQKRSPADTQTYSYLKEKAQQAEGFIQNLRKRRDLLLRSAQLIVSHQANFVRSNQDTDLRTLSLQQIADQTGVDISTMSRIVNQKYIQTPNGTFLLRHFFLRQAQNKQGQILPVNQIKQRIHEIIANEPENQPFSDEQIGQQLASDGTRISRRTVAKYRKQLNIARADQRKAR